MAFWNRKTAERKKPTRRDFVDLLGPLCQVLKRTWILATITLLSTVAAVWIPHHFVMKKTGAPLPDTAGWVIACGVAIAVSVILDKIADEQDKREAAASLRGSEDSAANAASDLNMFLVEAIEVAFVEGAALKKSTKALMRFLTVAAAKSIGQGSRATYYTLTYDHDKKRILGSPVHATEYGRSDKPKTPFVESKDLNHPIWRIMDGPDEEPEVVSAPTEVYELDWDTKKYKTFLSVPVKANDVQFGMLSVNNSTIGAIGESQRAIVLAMARSVALVLALQHGPRAMTSMLATPAAPVVSVTIETAKDVDKDGQ
jgi:hypothetical protein